MALAEVARFGSLPEAQVACSALQASGINAIVADTEPAAAMWREPYGRGGFRLCAPEADAAAARALLRRLAETPSEAPPHDPFETAPSLAERFTPLRLVIIILAFIAIAAFALLGRL